MKLQTILDNPTILKRVYKEIADDKPLGHPIKVEELTGCYEHVWFVLRNRSLEDLAERYAERFFDLLSRLEILEAILERLCEVDPDYEKTIVSAECPEDETATALTSAMALAGMLFRRLESRGLVRLAPADEIAVWLTEHAPRLGGKQGQLALF